MSKTLLFKIEIEVSEKIVDDTTILEIAEKIADGVVKQVNEEGLIPDYCDGSTEIIRVTPWFVNETIIKHI